SSSACPQKNPAVAPSRPHMAGAAPGRELRVISPDPMHRHQSCGREQGAPRSRKACARRGAREVSTTTISDQEAVMRLNYREVFPDALKAMVGLERAANGGLDDPRLLNLIKIRASQINGCAYCVRLHAGEARAGGETDERLDMVAVWREPTASDRRSVQHSPGVRRSRCSL